MRTGCIVTDELGVQAVSRYMVNCKLILSHPHTCAECYHISLYSLTLEEKRQYKE
jgi:hypothetical protein